MNTIIPGLNEPAYSKWLEDRPPAVQKMAKKYPPGTPLGSHGKFFFVVGYYEGYWEDDPEHTKVGIYVSETNPMKDAKTAIATKEKICPCCLNTLEGFSE